MREHIRMRVHVPWDVTLAQSSSIARQLAATGASRGSSRSSSKAGPLVAQHPRPRQTHVFIYTHFITTHFSRPSVSPPSQLLDGSLSPIIYYLLLQFSSSIESLWWSGEWFRSDGLWHTCESRSGPSVFLSIRFTRVNICDPRNRCRFRELVIWHTGWYPIGSRPPPTLHYLQQSSDSFPESFARVSRIRQSNRSPIGARPSAGKSVEEATKWNETNVVHRNGKVA